MSNAARPPRNRRSVGPGHNETESQTSNTPISTLGLNYKFGEIVWVVCRAPYCTWPARIDFVPMQLNPNYREKGIPEYPVFLYGTHNLLWQTQDMIFPNNQANYAKFLKKGRQWQQNQTGKNNENNTLFDKALSEMEKTPTIKSDIENDEDLNEFLDGKISLDISAWIDTKLVNLENLKD